MPAFTPVQAISSQNEIYFGTDGTDTEHVYANLGDIIQIPVSISNAEDHLDIHLSIEFDHNFLSLTDVVSRQGDNVTIEGPLIIGRSPDERAYEIEKEDEFVFTPEGPFDLDIVTLVFTAEAAVTDSQITIQQQSTIYDYDDPDVEAETEIGDPVFVTIDDQIVISNGTPSGELAKNTTSTTISVLTDHEYGYPTCKYALSEGVAYASMPYTFDNRETDMTNGNVTHSSVKTGLENGHSYKYYVKCQNEFGSINASDYEISFSIKDGKKKEVKKEKRKIYNSQKKIRQGETLVQRGKRFSKNSTVLLYFSKYGGGYYAPMSVKTSKSGTFSVSYRINKPKGTYKWYAVDTKTGKKSKTKTYRVI
mgnify:CR=1 FL=1